MKVAPTKTGLTKVEPTTIGLLPTALLRPAGLAKGSDTTAVSREPDRRLPARQWRSRPHEVRSESDRYAGSCISAAESSSLAMCCPQRPGLAFGLLSCLASGRG